MMKFREENYLTCRGKGIKILVDFSSEITEARRQRNEIFKYL